MPELITIHIGLLILIVKPFGKLKFGMNSHWENSPTTLLCRFTYWKKICGVLRRCVTNVHGCHVIGN